MNMKMFHNAFSFSKKLLYNIHCYRSIFVASNKLIAEESRSDTLQESKITDGLSDKTQDYLGRKSYVEEIVQNFVRAHESGEEIVFALSAKWGSGKTWMLNIAEPMFREKGFSVVWFNAWEFSQEKTSIRRALLRKSKEDLHSQVDISSLYQDSTKVESPALEFLYGKLKSFANMVWRNKLVTSITVLILSQIIVLVTTNYNSIMMSMLDRVAYIALVFNQTLLGLLLVEVVSNIYAQVLYLFKLISENYLSLSAIFGGALAVSLPRLFYVEKTTSSAKTSEEFSNKFAEILKGHDKVVIFVDDLDRCAPNAIQEILDSLVTFFSHCSFIVTGDHSVIEPTIGKLVANYTGKTQVDEKIEGKRFLKKIFNVYWKIPNPDPRSLEEYTRSCVKKVSFLDESERDGLAMMLKNHYSKNLRKIERCTYSLDFLYRTVSRMITEKQTVISELDEKGEQIPVEYTEGLENLKDIKKHPLLLAKVFLISEIYEEAFDALQDVQGSRIILWQEKQIRDTGKIESFYVDQKVNISMNKFIRPEEQVAYQDFIADDPQFSSSEKTIADPASFFYVSGLTGLPSRKGADLDTFVELVLKSERFDSLVDLWQESSEAVRKRLVKKTVDGLDETLTQDQRIDAVANILQLTRIDTIWFDAFDHVVEMISSNSSAWNPQAREIVYELLFLTSFDKLEKLEFLLNKSTHFSSEASISSLWSVLEDDALTLEVKSAIVIELWLDGQVEEGVIGYDNAVKYLGLIFSSIGKNEDSVKYIQDVLKKVLSNCGEHEHDYFSAFIPLIAEYDLDKSLVDSIDDFMAKSIGSKEWTLTENWLRLFHESDTLTSYITSQKLKKLYGEYSQLILKENVSIWRDLMQGWIDDEILSQYDLHRKFRTTLVQQIHDESRRSEVIEFLSGNSDEFEFTSNEEKMILSTFIEVEDNPLRENCLKILLASKSFKDMKSPEIVGHNGLKLRQLIDATDSEIVHSQTIKLYKLFYPQSKVFN